MMTLITMMTNVMHASVWCESFGDFLWCQELVIYGRETWQQGVRFYPFPRVLEYKKSVNINVVDIMEFQVYTSQKIAMMWFLRVTPIRLGIFFLSLPIEALYGMTTCLSHHLQPIFVRVRHLWSRDPPFWRPWTSKTLSFKVCIPKPTLCITCVRLEAPNVCMW